MSTSTEGPTPSPDIVSSILLAMWQMHVSCPEKVLPHLVNPPPPNDYRFLDALATLCSFVPECERASAAIELGTDFSRLYIATSPPAPSTLREVMPAWIRLIQHMADINVTSSSSVKGRIDPKPGGALEDPGPRIENFIAGVYRICYTKLLDSVRDDDADDLLQELSDASESRMENFGLKAGDRPVLIEGLKVMIGMAEQHAASPPSSITTEEIMELYAAARAVAKFKDRFMDADYVVLAHRLSEAVDFIVAFATSQRSRQTFGLHQDVAISWIDPPASREFIATMNTREFMGDLSDDEVAFLKVPDDFAGPPKHMSQIDGSPDHVKGTGATHCEAALLQHVLDHDLTVDRYIGASHPVCYACLMLVRACNRAFQKNFVVGRRCQWGTVDTTWLCPEMDLKMGAQLREELVSSLRQDFWVLCDKARVDWGVSRSLGGLHFAWDSEHSSQYS